MEVYLDNAATTPIDPVVVEAMMPYMKNQYGNPSSIHAHGRKTRSAIERSRKKIAELLNASPAEIFFTSGGTEADNTAIIGAIEKYDIQHIISTKIEHHAVMHTIEFLEKCGKVKTTYLDLDEKGNFEPDQLSTTLRDNPKSLVSIMQGNNEIGNLTDIEEIAELCQEYGSLLHSDTVQTVGHFTHNLQKLKADFIVGSAHKFHGPKGIGFLYIKNGNKIPPYIHGGAQERNMRGGTENVYGVVGLTEALSIAYENMESHRKHILDLKNHMISQLKGIPGIEFNGDSDDEDKSLYTVLNVCTPASDNNDMLLFNLDIKGISASGGSACSSGSDIGSHVIAALNKPKDRGTIRFSFSKMNTKEEIDYTVACLKDILS